VKVRHERTKKNTRVDAPEFVLLNAARPHTCAIYARGFKTGHHAFSPEGGHLNLPIPRHTTVERVDMAPLIFFSQLTWKLVESTLTASVV
jgi:hypothetical protein